MCAICQSKNVCWLLVYFTCVEIVLWISVLALFNEPDDSWFTKLLIVFCVFLVVFVAAKDFVHKTPLGLTMEAFVRDIFGPFHIYPFPHLVFFVAFMMHVDLVCLMAFMAFLNGWRWK